MTLGNGPCPDCGSYEVDESTAVRFGQLTSHRYEMIPQPLIVRSCACGHEWEVE